MQRGAARGDEGERLADGGEKQTRRIHKLFHFVPAFYFSIHKAKIFHLPPNKNSETI